MAEMELISDGALVLMLWTALPKMYTKFGLQQLATVLVISNALKAVSLL